MNKNLQATLISGLHWKYCLLFFVVAPLHHEYLPSTSKSKKVQDDLIEMFKIVHSLQSVVIIKQ